MRTGRPTPLVVLSAEERLTLEQWARRPTTAQALAQRARLVLACASTQTNGEIASAAGVTRQTVGCWRHRFVRKRLQGLLDEPRPGAPRKITDAEVERVIALTLERTPPDATHWSTRAMAKRSGLSQTAVSRIWRAFGLQPHRSKTFKLSKDPLFIDKVRDIVGLYLDPPDKALVLCVDEKSQIQALDRTQPVLSNAARAGRASDPRLHAAWDHHAVRRAGCHERRDHRRIPSAPPRPRISQVPGDDRCRGPS
jgi:transposase